MFEDWIIGPQGSWNADTKRVHKDAISCSYNSVKFLGTFNDTYDLIVRGQQEYGNAYLVNGDLYIWTGPDTKWVNTGGIIRSSDDTLVTSQIEQEQHNVDDAWWV